LAIVLTDLWFKVSGYRCYFFLSRLWFCWLHSQVNWLVSAF